MRERDTTAETNRDGTRPAPQARRTTPASLANDASHILIVDDDQRIRDLLKRYLKDHQYRVSAAKDVATAETLMQGLVFDLLVLDRMMPGVDGLSFAQTLRQSSEIPILMITARGETDERIEGLESGVDDYIVKPFEPRELLLRINNVLKRMDVEDQSVQEIRMGTKLFQITRGELRDGDGSIKLTERERELMRLFASRVGDVIPRHELFAEETTGSERAIDVQINRLRRKIEADPANPVYLQTVRGKGYILHCD
ncbi:MAG: response regulator transcription factor [Pseudomonadota bacterium]